MGARDQLLHDHIQHGAGCKGEQPGHQRLEAAHHQDGEQGENGLHDAGQGPHPKGFGPAEPFLAQRQGDGSPLGEVLDADTQGQSDGGGELGGGVPLGGQRKGDAHRHPLRDVVESDGQDQKGGPAAQMAEGFRGELGEQGVHGQQEGDAQDGPPSGRDPSHHAHGLRLLDGGDQEAPHAGGDHHAGGEPQEDPVDRGVRAAPEEKYGGRPQGGEQSGEPCSAGGP